MQDSPGRASPSEQTIRAFVALELDTASLRRVIRVADCLRTGSGAPSATWTPAAKVHVTLTFLGSVSLDRAEPLAKALARLAEEGPPKSCAIRLGAFPDVEEARIIVVELKDETGALARLAEKVDRSARKLGVPADERPFRPHVTLARLKRPYDARRWLRQDIAEAAGECAASSITLFRSDLGAEGSEYTPLARLPF
jgi:RNA 2',3'-cyclic 3'-phosphodiesterase